MPKSKRVALLAISIGLSGCVTTPEPASGQRAEGMQLLMNNTCVISSNSDGYTTKRKSTFIITSVREGQDGWFSASAVPAKGGFIDNFYYNEETGERICGSQNFHDRGYRFVPR